MNPLLLLILLWTCAPYSSCPTQAMDQKAEGTNPNDRTLHTLIDEPFPLARAQILNAGWKPVRPHLNDRYEYSGTETELIQHGFKEIYSCTVDAGSLCRFYYRQAGHCLRVDTIGEQLRDMNVTHWLYECPPEEQTPQSRSGAPSGK